MGELCGWDAEVSAFVCPFTGRWPTQDESSPAAGALRGIGGGSLGRNRPTVDTQDAQFFTPQLRWARWDAAARTLEVGVGPAVAARSQCLMVYIYLPATTSASSPLLFSGEGVPRGVSKALQALSERAAGRRTPLSVLVGQAVAAIDAGMRGEDQGGEERAPWSGSTLLDKGMMFDDVALDCRQNTKVLDVLVCFAAAACRSIKKVSLLDPFPLAFLDAQGGTDFDACTQSLLALPPLDTLFAEGSRPLPTQQGLLLRWLCDLKGVVVKGIKGASAVTEHAGAGDFVVELCHGNEPTFDQAAEAYGTVRAFHGSALENFHCILRCGLKSFSGTKRMNTGDVYGEGVYLSSDYRLARSFASRGKVWSGSGLGTYVTCVACCRIALHPSIKRQKETAKLAGAAGRPLDAIPHTYYVVPDPRFVRVESIIVIPDGAENANQRDRARATAVGRPEAQGQVIAGGVEWGVSGMFKILLFVVLGWVVSIVGARLAGLSQE